MAPCFVLTPCASLSFVGLLIYAGIIYHRHRKGALRGTYAPAVNPALAEHQGLTHDSSAAAYPAYPSHAAYGEPLKQQHYELNAQQPQTYGYAGQSQGYSPQGQGYPPQTQGYSAEQYSHPQYGHVS